MERDLNQHEERLQQLLEEKSFDQLTNEEQSFVLEHISKEEYQLRRSIIVESQFMDHEEKARPLVIPQKSKGVVIPLYQAVAAVAAAVIVSFFVFRSEEVVVEPGNEVILAQTDTVYVDKLIHDTIIEYKTKYISRTIASEQSNPSESNVAFGGSVPILPELSTMDLENRGTSAKNDEVLTLLVDFTQF